MIKVFVQGEPKGQPRARAFAFRGRARVYDPGTAEGWKSQIAVAFRDLITTQFAGPVSLTIQFCFPRPRKHFRTGARFNELRDDAPICHTAKPDADNAAKAVMDALTVLGVWKDDTQVAKLVVTKFYGSNTGALICVSDYRPELALESEAAQ